MRISFIQFCVFFVQNLQNCASYPLLVQETGSNAHIPEIQTVKDESLLIIGIPLLKKPLLVILFSFSYHSNKGLCEMRAFQVVSVIWIFVLMRNPPSVD